ncbi:Retrotransposon protein [Nesidiocoris tenuis]|uniref:Retrotransposon protein n=1 Tax=Nesidiocoris tenuis TaxID=355587 RepID=A0ABN7AB22_9HEMI|nr:Retrotransposon protein [Nesidiocoris tenuis]
MAVEHALTHPPQANVVIVSDSRSVLLALQNITKGCTTPLHLINLHDSIQRLYKKANNLKIQWNPSHVGLLHDSTADKLANETSKRAQIDQEETLWHHDEIKRFKAECLHNWTQVYTNSEGPGRWTRTIVSNPNNQPWFKNQMEASVRNITKANRILLGHGTTNLFKFRMKSSSDPWCRLCGEEEMEDIEHLLASCRTTAPLVERILREENQQNLQQLRAERIQLFLQRSLKNPKFLFRLAENLEETGIKI